MNYPTTYTTLDDAIAREIIEPIESGGAHPGLAAEYDLRAIADEIFEFDEDGQCFYVREGVGEDEFWETVMRHERFIYTACLTGAAGSADDSDD